ncbi:UNVERIFIED_CONTAM: hypothetical protein K2H54_047134 [Gekko kuhli]
MDFSNAAAFQKVCVLLANELMIELLIPEPEHEMVEVGFFDVLELALKSQSVQGGNIVRGSKLQRGQCDKALG